MTRTDRIASAALLTFGVVLLWWGANWKVALGGYCLASWAYGKQGDAWKAFERALFDDEKTA